MGQLRLRSHAPPDSHTCFCQTVGHRKMMYCSTGRKSHLVHWILQNSWRSRWPTSCGTDVGGGAGGTGGRAVAWHVGEGQAASHPSTTRPQTR